MRRKLFNIFNIGGGGGGEASDANFNTCGGYCKNVHTRMHAHTHQCTYETHVHAPKCSYILPCMHACTHICMHTCTCRYIKTIIFLHSYMKIKANALYDIEFRESGVSPGRTEVKQAKFVKYIFRRRVILEKLINHKT